MEPGIIIADAGDLGSASRSNRQKKLQLRKVGFKARNMPARNITPRRDQSWSKSSMSAASWASKITPLLDADCVAEIQAATPTTVLKEINNSTRRRKKHNRARVEEAVFIYQDENIHASPPKAPNMDRDSRFEELAQCGTPGSPNKTRSPNKGTPARSRTQSVSVDTIKYIEHLEAELAAVQTQLSAMTSPTVTQARSVKMRALNAETRALQDEVSEWERKFHERVQEEIEERTKIESALKSRIRLLEGDATDYSQKIQDLQGQLEKDKDTITAAESANLELERRIDAISGLVASPKRKDLERAKSAASRRHSRQKSLLPRFPTTGSMSLMLPQRGRPETPTTPTGLSSDGTDSSSSENGDGGNSPDMNVNLDALSALTGDDGRPQSSHSEKAPSSSRSKHFSWASPECFGSLDPAAANSNGRPSRRMRRFHAGMTPKPLLLPSTTSCNYIAPATTTSVEKDNSQAGFPFPDLTHLAGAPSTYSFETLLSPMPGKGRRRALSSIEGVAAAMRRAANPFLSPMPFPAAMGTSSSRPSTSSSAAIDSTSAAVEDLSSLGPQPVGRNLFDELQQIRDVDSGEVSSPRLECTTDNDNVSIAGSWASTTRSISARKRAWTSHHRTLSDQTGLSVIKAALEVSDAHDHMLADDEEAAHGFSAVMAAVFRQTYDTARQCLTYAQCATIRSATVQRLQWWLVQLFLGPMATRRMMATSIRQGRRAVRTRRVESLEASSRAAASRSSSSSSSSYTLGPDIWVDGIHGRELKVAKPSRKRRSNKKAKMVELPMTWINRHNPWLWIRFSLALLFAIGAAMRDGPATVMGLLEEEDKIE